MAIGDYLSNMFLGNSSNEPSDASKKGTDELWKLYQQAYNVKPVWDGKKWTIPPGAVQRFQMLLPMLQAQIAAGKSGQRQGGDEYGLLGGLLKEGTRGLYKEYGGITGIGKKIGGAVSDWFTPASKASGGLDGFTPQESPTFDMGAQPFDMGSPTFDSLPVDNTWGDTFDSSVDWSNFTPTDSYDLVTAFTPEEYASAGDWW